MRYCYCFASTAKQKTLKTPLTAVLANALVAQSTVIATECNKVFVFSLKNVYAFIKKHIQMLIYLHIY